eukprot:jgi/Botrbrau1/23405/Bobra.0051s0049.1
MSSLAAARADNFYYPPEWDPKKGGLNKQQGQHPLRERARKLDQGILIIRFEMPFNVWCEGCNHLIGKGVRFNAEKKQIGTYFSSKIWSFVMRSPCCQTRIEVQTDPKNAEYVVVSGARRKVEAFSARDAETLELPGPEDKLEYDDPLYKMEREQEDKSRAIQAATQLERLYERSSATSRNDSAVNATLRRHMRAARKAEKARDQIRETMGLPEAVRLLPENPADIEHASLITFGDASAHDKARRLHRQAIRAQSIFSTPPAQKARLATAAPPLLGSAPARITGAVAARSGPHTCTASAGTRPPSALHAAAPLPPVTHPNAPAWMHAPAPERGQGGAGPPAGGADPGKPKALPQPSRLGLLTAGPMGQAGAGNTPGSVTEMLWNGRGGAPAMVGAPRDGKQKGGLSSVKAGKVKKRSVADRASQLLVRRKMDSALKLALPVPDLVHRSGPTYKLPRR